MAPRDDKKLYHPNVRVHKSYTSLQALLDNRRFKFYAELITSLEIRSSTSAYYVKHEEHSAYTSKGTDREEQIKLLRSCMGV